MIEVKEISNYCLKKGTLYLQNGKVKLVSAEGGNLFFRVNGHEVFRTSKGEWSCNAAVKGKDGIKKGCVIFGNRNNLCSHIIAASLWLYENKNL